CRRPPRPPRRPPSSVPLDCVGTEGAGAGAGIEAWVSSALELELPCSSLAASKAPAAMISGLVRLPLGTALFTALSKKPILRLLEVRGRRAVRGPSQCCVSCTLRQGLYNDAGIKNFFATSLALRQASSCEKKFCP